MCASSAHNRSRKAPPAARYLGLELSGAKNPKTALASIQYFPQEKKVFLVDIFEKVAGSEDQSSDEALLELIDELRPGTAALAVNVPLDLPPCIHCSDKTCSPSSQCRTAPVRWMNQLVRKVSKNPPEGFRVRDITPYTQRPVELWIRYEIMPRLDSSARFEIDEALGGNKAPLTARMLFLKRHLKGLRIREAWPKLTVATLQKELDLSRRTIEGYRHLEEGVHARQEILEALVRVHHVFIYDRDMKTLSASLAAFDAFICAYTALLSDLGRCAKRPKGFPGASGWVEYPSLRVREGS